jgi:putative transposase
LVTAAQRRTAVAHVQIHAGVSQRHACRWLGVQRSPVRYVAHPRRDDAPLRARLREVAVLHPRWGAPLLTWALQREGWTDNHKRIERVYRLDGLAVRTRRRKKLTRPRAPHAPALVPNARWSMDILRDTLAAGRVIRLFTVVDECKREALQIAVDTSFPGTRVVRALDSIAAVRGYPTQVICNNGPAFIGSAVVGWAQQPGVQLVHIEPGKPNQNACVESLNGRVCDEWLNQHWFLSLADARRTLTAYPHLYNTGRRYGAHGTLTPFVRGSAEDVYGRFLAWRTNSGSTRH